jgi:hypothetical protein
MLPVLINKRILIIGGYLIYRKPESVGKWGVAILVASIVSLYGMGGFLIGIIIKKSMAKDPVCGMV